MWTSSSPGCRNNVIVSWHPVYWFIISLQHILSHGLGQYLMCQAHRNDETMRVEHFLFAVPSYQKITFGGGRRERVLYDDCFFVETVTAQPRIYYFYRYFIRHQPCRAFMCRILVAHGCRVFDWLIGEKSEEKFIDVSEHTEWFCSCILLCLWLKTLFHYIYCPVLLLSKRAFPIETVKTGQNVNQGLVLFN